LLVDVQAAAPAWQRMIAYPIAFVVLSVPQVTIALLLCRFSFSADEMRDMHRPRHEAKQQPASAGPEATP
jgi:hypothetical protein